MVVNSLHRVLLDVFGGGSFEVPPGRPLYSYRCSNENYQKIQSFLKEKADEMGHGKNAPVFVHEAFCLYVSEWVRRNHKTGHVRWKDILDSLGWPSLTNSTLSYLTESGLKYWSRPLRTKGNKPAYLLTLVLEGGLPLRMMEDNQGTLVNYFRRVLTGIRQNTNQYIQGDEIAESYEELLPKSLRNQAVFSLTSEFCNVLHKLASSADAYRTDTLSAIKRFKPDWFKELPVVLNECHAEILARAVYADGEKHHTNRPTLRVYREWVKDDNECWNCEVSYKLPLSIKHGSLVQHFDLDTNSNAIRLTLRGVSENGSDVIALLSKEEDNQWSVEKYPASRNILTGANALQQVSFELFDGMTHVGTYVSSGGVALSNELPWVLEATNEYANELRFIGVGSLSTTADIVYLAMPTLNSMLMLDSDGEIGIPEVLDGSDRYLVPITGNYTVRLEDGQCCLIKTSQEQEYAPHYLFGKASYKNISSRYPIFKGSPVIYKINGGDYERVSESELYWRRLRGGISTWHSFADSSPVGKVEIRQVVDNEVRHSTRCIIFPEMAEVSLNAQSEKSGKICFTGLGDVHIADLDSGEYSEITTELFQDKLSLNVVSKVTHHRPLNLQLSWPEAESAKITIPFPAHGCRLIGFNRELGGRLTTNRLFGVIAEGVQIEGGENRFFVEIEEPMSKLIDPNTKSKLEKSSFEMLTLSDSSTRSFNLSTLQAPLESMLSNVNQGESVNLRLYTAGSNDLLIHVALYPYQIFYDEKNVCVASDVDSTEIDSRIRFLAHNIFSHDEETVILEMDQRGKISVDILEQYPGVWLVYGECDGKIVTNQLIHKSDTYLAQDNSLVKRAFFDIEAAQELIDELKTTLASKTWMEFLDLLNSVSRYHPRSFPILELLCNEDTLLLATLFHSIFKGTQEQVWELESSFSVCWGSIPNKTWAETIGTFEKDCTTNLGLPPQMLLMADAPLRTLATRDWRAKSGLNVVIQHISNTTNHSLPSIEMASETQVNQALQDLLRLVDGLPLMRGFPKTAYISAFESFPEIKNAVKGHWVTNRYHKKVEFLLNHTLVAAAMTLLPAETEKEFKLLQPLLNLVHQQAPEHLGPIFNYFQKNLVK